MKKILLTFLGNGDYTACHYNIAGSLSKQETFFCHALADHLSPDEVFSLQTEKSHCKHGAALHEGFTRRNMNHHAISIPEGKNETELWQLFDCLTRDIPSKCELFLDITHGFRSLPLLGFLALSYLRVTRRINIGGVYYGAYEARTDDHTTPAFNLTPFLTLMDWTAAADQFLHSGDASRIGELMRNTQRLIHTSPNHKGSTNLPTLLSTLGNVIEGAAADRILLRTSQLASSSESIKKQMARIQQTTELENHVPAFLQILEPVQNDLTKHQSSDLTTLRDLVFWLVERKRPDAALTLANEWIVSWLMVLSGEPDGHSHKEARSPYENSLNQMIAIKSKEEVLLTPLTQKIISMLSETQFEQLVRVASMIKNARNDLNHAGFRSSPMPSKSIIETAQGIAGELANFSLVAHCP